MMPKIIFLNSKANNNRALKKWSYFLLHTNNITDKDLIYDSLKTTTELALKISEIMLGHIKTGHRHFVAAGGDGTFNTLVNAYGLLTESEKEGIILGAIGLGSSNDFHKPIESYISSPYGKIPYRLNFKTSSQQDLCFAIFNNNKKYFTINAGLGLTAAGNDFFNKNGLMIRFLKSIHIELAIIFASIVSFIKYKNFSVEMELLGKNGKHRKKLIKLSNFGIIKKRYFAGSLHYPEAPSVNDGKYYIYGFFNLPRLSIIKNFIGLYKGNIMVNKNFIHEISDSISFKSSDEFPFETDGEVYYSKHVEFKIEQKGIMICL